MVAQFNLPTASNGELPGYRKNIAHPINGADGRVRLQVNFVFPVKRKDQAHSPPPG